MNKDRTPSIAAAVLLTLGMLAPASCAQGPETRPVDTEAKGAAPSSAEALSPIALRIEQAERKLDLGREIPAAREALATALADPVATADQRDQAKLGLSRVLEAEGDREGATSAVEALLAEHSESVRWPLQEAAEKRLRLLLTGSERAPFAEGPEEPRQASPFAHALALSLAGPASGQRDAPIHVLAFGGSEEVSHRLGTFALGSALRELARQACPVCDDRQGINTLSSRTSGWIGIPASRPRLGSSLAVFYFDLGSERIPARYDAELPLPSAEIVAHLERGQGLIAVRERKGAPPAILLAAPRRAQLAAVEEALAAMKSIPKEPVVVPVSASLSTEEIQRVVRGAFGSYRACYEELLTRSPTAAGSIPLKFAIEGDGSVSELRVDAAAATLHDATFEQCMLTKTAPLVFTAVGVKTTVTYPIAFAPGD